MEGKYFYNRNLDFKEKFLSLDFILISLILLLGIISFFAIYSTEKGNFDYFTENHIYRFFTFFVVFIVISFIDVRFWYKSAYIIYFLALVFWLFGSTLLQMMGININSFRIVGGMFLMVIAYQMVFEQRQKRREETAEEAMDDEELSSLATFPIAIPLMAGPGAITLVMLLSEKSGSSIENQIIGFSPIFIVLMLNAISMWASGKIAKRLPISVSSALQRTFGLLLGALAIEFVIEGLRQTFSI